MSLEPSLISSLRRRAAKIYATEGSSAVLRRGARYVVRLPNRLWATFVLATAGVHVVDCPDIVIAGSMYKVRLRFRTWAQSQGARTFPAFRIRYRFSGPDGGSASGANAGMIAGEGSKGWTDVEGVVEAPDRPGDYALRLELLLEGDFALFAGTRRVVVSRHTDELVRARMPALDVTMDLTSKCPLRCIQCRKTYSETLDNQHDMEFDLFKKIAADVFPHARFVMLSSAGEPMMSRHFMEAIEITRRYAVQEIGFTSSGAHLNPRRAEQIVDLGVGRAEFSVDGATAPVYNSIRVGSDFDKVIGNIRHLAAYKQQKKTRLPIIRFNVVLMRRNVEELAALVDLLADVGGEEVLCQHMIVFNEATRAESLLFDKERSNRAITLAKERAALRGIRFYHPPLFTPAEQPVASTREPEERRADAQEPCYAVEGEYSFERAGHASAPADRPRCTDPWRKIAFDWQGMVYPCCMWKEQPIGDMRTHTFEEVWNSEAYRHLRETLLTGPLMKSCAECSAITGGDVNNEASFFF